MRSVHPNSRLPLRPLAACLAVLMAGPASALVETPLGGMAEPLQYARPQWPSPLQPATPRAPQDIVVTNCFDSGAGSLRDSIGGAVSGDIIDLTQLQCSTITLTSGAIIFAADQLALHGPGRHELRIQGGPTANDGVLVHLGFGTLIVEDVTLADGRKYRSDVNALGGCIQSQGNVILRDSTVTGCKAQSQSNHGSLGGGVWSQGSTHLYTSEISGNETYASGNGYASGGGVYALGGFFSQSSVITGNIAHSPSATPSFGGGVFARGYGGVFQTAIVQNSSARMGGLAIADNGTSNAFIFQSTISTNSAHRIGGVYVRRPLFLYNSTIANNHSQVSIAGASNSESAGLHMGAQVLTFHSNILADNVADDVGGHDLGGEPGMLNTGTFNLITATPIPPPPDTIGFTPALGPLQDNGGPTPTHALVFGQSYAIDSGGLPPAGIFTFDQRGTGFPRWVGSHVDIGSFESDPDRIFTTGLDFGLQLLAATTRRPD
ncbi:MAG: hypothetical protein EOP90_15140 [Lysobacteraceae bacterium]|nr:MAG: hypothetical protein EOP90_15140 [Xanthomonadaceae bacterium]